MKNLSSLKFWFDLRPDALSLLSQKIFLVLIVVLIFSVIVFGYIKSLKKKNLYTKIFDKLYYFSLVNGVIGLLLMFFNYEMVPFLTARFWYLLWFIILVVWLFFIIKSVIKIPQKQQQIEKEKKFNQYIP